jgi:hypothetical protein
MSVKHFPHYLNARNDRKIRKGRLQLGIEFYAIYFMILEVLAEQKDFRYPLADIDILADDFGTSIQKIQLVITQYDLFEIDPVEQFFSPAQVKALQPYLQKLEHYKLMGKKSALARKLKAEQQIEELKKLSRDDSSQPTLNDGSTYAEQLTNKLTNKLNKSTLSINQLPKHFHSQETFVNYIRGKFPNQIIGNTIDKYTNKEIQISVSEKGRLYDKISGETFTGTRAMEIWSGLYELALKGELPILNQHKEAINQ